MHTYQPETRSLRVMTYLSGRRGYVGRSFGRKLKRRYQWRALDDFNKAVAGLTPSDLVFDFGANVGKYTRKLAASGARVHAYEPDPETCQTLRENTADLKNVSVHQQAVGVKAGQATLRRVANYQQDQANNSLATSVVYNDARMQGGETFQVDVVSFWDLLDAHPAPEIIKMDIEGAEMEILDTLFSQPSMPEFGKLFVETHEYLAWKNWPKVQALRAQANAQASAQGGAYINLYWM